MARLARVVVSGVPHLATQRGSRREEVFFGEGDYAAYRGMLAEAWDGGLVPMSMALRQVEGAEEFLERAGEGAATVGGYSE